MCATRVCAATPCVLSVDVGLGFGQNVNDGPVADAEQAEPRVSGDVGFQANTCARRPPRRWEGHVRHSSCRPHHLPLLARGRNGSGGVHSLQQRSEIIRSRSTPACSLAAVGGAAFSSSPPPIPTLIRRCRGRSKSNPPVILAPGGVPTALPRHPSNPLPSSGFYIFSIVF